VVAGPALGQGPSAAAAAVVIAGPVLGQGPTAVAAAAAAGPSHQWGQGLSVGQFTAALQALPMQQRVRWKSVYPEIGAGARGKVYQAINLETGEQRKIVVGAVLCFIVCVWGVARGGGGGGGLD
jgi:hypothetical protein